MLKVALHWNNISLNLNRYNLMKVVDPANVYEWTLCE